MVRCKRCNKELTVPKSIKRGYGPVCWAKLQTRADSQGVTMDAFLEDYEKRKEKEEVIEC